MSEVNAEVLADLMSALQNGDTFQNFVVENNLRGTVTPMQLRKQFVDSFGQETLQNIMKNNMSERMNKRWVNVASRMNDIQKIDEMISSFESAIATFEARKAELGQQ